MTRNPDEPTSPTKLGNKKRETKKRARPANVIHVAFGPGGGRLVEAPKKKTEAHPATANTRAEDLVTDLFSKKEVSKLLGLSEGRLRVLDKNEIVSPSGE